MRKRIIDNLLIEGVNFAAAVSGKPISVISILNGWAAKADASWDLPGVIRERQQ
jgi:hypothetical protein